MSKNFDMAVYYSVLKKLMAKDKKLFTGSIGETELQAIDYARDKAKIVHSDINAHMALLSGFGQPPNGLKRSAK